MSAMWFLQIVLIALGLIFKSQSDLLPGVWIQLSTQELSSDFEAFPFDQQLTYALGQKTEKV